ncbi:MAG: GDP-mannose 4,6-dehydratase [Candidatus Neomarinimicrobiota bacterium]|nr:GDP-mannose 4,6-dehydratase [Candidatus Neomarinimicrobiota bacterium]|tara:strand:+ start:63 stop:1043 length:981 start_codon:yes stop_codon:yes gene_type:complete
MKKILITGVAGFIGYHLADKLLSKNYQIIGIDNLNDYYDPILKQDRLNNLKKFSNFEFHKIDFIQNNELTSIFNNNQFNQVIHLGAQAGVRYSITNPQFYIDTNITGFLNILENCNNYNVENIIYASSSSIYGDNNDLLFSENDKTEKQISMYGVSKKTNELMAHTYSNLYGLKTIGLRFFTVYGPWGRPDMALYIFTKAIIENKNIDLFNKGSHTRSFTYISDIVEPIYRLIKINENNQKILSNNDILNIGGSEPVKLLRFIDIIEDYLGKKAKIKLKPMQQGDIQDTNADITKLKKITDYKPQVDIEEGIKRFIDWYKAYHQTN